MKYSIEILSVEFSYLKSADVILAIDSLQVESGKTVFLYGPSGSGKTTLLGLIAGIHKPTHGQVQVLGHKINEMNHAAVDRFRGIHTGYIFQQFNLIPYLTLRENIELPCRLHKERLKKAEQENPLEEEVFRLSSRLQIESHLNQLPGSVSTGQSQRAAAARALLGRPEIIIADEPTSALDSDRKESFIHLLFENCKRTSSTLIFVSHDRSLEKQFDLVYDLTKINQINTARGPV